jgi:hypothetical protein
MKTFSLCVAALVAAVVLTTAAAAGSAAAKQRVALDMMICSPGKSQGTFVLTPLDPFGSLKRDTGTISSNWTSTPGNTVMRRTESHDLQRCSDDTHRKARSPHDPRPERVD